MSGRSLSLAGGAFMAILAAPVAADPCPDLRFALAREELAARMFNEHESEPAALAWRDSI